MVIIMDEQFEQYTDTFFSERHSNILVKIRKENYQHSMLIKQITIIKEKLKNTAPDEIWSLVEILLKLLNLQNQTEGKYLYVQGMEDCRNIFHFLKTKYVNNDYDEIQLSKDDDGFFKKIKNT